MRKIVALITILLLVSTFSFAQIPREASFVGVVNLGDFNNKTNFTAISVQGLNTDGNPGYIEFVNTGSPGVRSSTVYSYFLYVDQAGKLRLASAIKIANSSVAASFPTGNWQIPNWARASGVVVGTQCDQGALVDGNCR